MKQNAETSTALTTASARLIHEVAQNNSNWGVFGKSFFFYLSFLFFYFFYFFYFFIF
jgi:hypothetical protein